MTQVASNIPSLLKRVARVSVIAVFTASTLAMLGMTADKAGLSRKAKAAAVAKRNVVATPAAAATETHNWEEALNDAVLAASFVRAPARPELTAAALPRTYTRRMEVTAYCPCTKCCGEN